MCQLILLGQMLDLVKYSTLEHIKKLPPSLGKQSWLQTTVSSSPWVHAEVLGEHHLGLQMSYRSFGQLGSPTDTSGGGGSGSSGDSSREEDCSGMPKIFHVECRGKKSHELFSRGFVFLRVLFLERGPLETRQPMARLLAAADWEGLIICFQAFWSCYLHSCFLSSLVVVFLSTSQGLILVLFLDLFETASYWKVVFTVLSHPAVQPHQLPLVLSQVHI